MEVKKLKESKKLIIALMCIILPIVLSSTASAQDWEGEAGAFLGLGLAMCAISVLVWFIIWIVIAIWVYRDAEKRGKSGALWLIIVILLGLIGIIIWLIVRPPIGGAPVQQVQQPAPGRTCPNCGRAIPMDARACPYCAKKFEE